jgi:hypothetical protein
MHHTEYQRVYLRNRMDHIEIKQWCTDQFGVSEHRDPEPRWTWGSQETGGRLMYHFRTVEDFMWFKLRWAEKTYPCPDEIDKMNEEIYGKGN